MYTGIAALGFLLFLWILPETKGKTLEEMEEIFERPWTETVPCGSRRRKNRPDEKTQLRTDFSMKETS